MRQARTSYYSKIYKEFRSIEAMEWRTIVRFYEEYEDEIKGLEFEEFFELLLAYTNALFEIGAYEKHLQMADVVLETSISNNIKFFYGEDVFQNTLFKKAASCYHIFELEKSDYILREILRIDPYDEDAALFLKKCLRKMSPAIVRRSRAAFIFLVILSVLTVCVEMVFIKNLYPMYSDSFEYARNGSLLLGFVILALGSLYHRFRTNQEVNNFVRQLRKRKKN